METKTRARKGTPKIESAEVFGDKLAKLTDGTPVSAALIDLDGFKELNDRVGLATGDAALKSFFGSLRHGLPSESIVARIGGDLFACLIPGAAPEQALLALEKVRSELEKPQALGKQRLPIPFSAGIASFPHHTENPEKLLEAADEALHSAKKQGGGRVVIFVEEKMVLKSNYYARAQLGRLAALAKGLSTTEAALLREALSDLFEKYSDVT